jgi:hypothetical protein
LRVENAKLKKETTQLKKKLRNEKARTDLKDACLKTLDTEHKMLN